MFGWLKRIGSAGRDPGATDAGIPLGEDAGSGRDRQKRAPGDAEKFAADSIARGLAAANRGDYVKAADGYRQALELTPDDAGLRVVLGFALIEQKAYAEARGHLNRAILLDPGNAQGFYLLGRMAQEQGDLTGAIENFREALEIAPSMDAIYGSLASAYLLGGHPDSAEKTLVDAIAAFPDSPVLLFELGWYCWTVNDLARAGQCYRDAIRLDPQYHKAHSNLGIVLLKEGHLPQAVDSFERALQIDPANIEARSHLLWALTFFRSGSSDRYQREAQIYGEHVRYKARPYTSWRNQGSRGSQTEGASKDLLKLGFVSGDFRAHPVGYFLEGVLGQLNRSKVELVAYSMNPEDDDLTERLKGYFAAWTGIAGFNDEQAARKIHQDGVDILIDLSGHSAYNRLPVFAWKPAPAQVSWLGYLASTGVPGMDYVLADPVSVPAQFREQFAEKVWHLPETIFCFTPPPEHPKLGQTPLPALRNGYITFGSFQRINKISDETLVLWGRVLEAMPDARFCLRNQDLNGQEARDRMVARLKRCGMQLERTMIEPGVPVREDYLATLGQVDVILDTLPHPGVTTACEALWMGVPTITLAGKTMLGRIGASLLTCVGMTDWVAWSEDDYVALAVKHGSDTEGLARLRAGMRQQVAVTPLFDATVFAPQFEKALLDIWQRRDIVS